MNILVQKNKREKQINIPVFSFTSYILRSKVGIQNLETGIHVFSSEWKRPGQSTVASVKVYKLIYIGLERLELVKYKTVLKRFWEGRERIMMGVYQFFLWTWMFFFWVKCNVQNWECKCHCLKVWKNLNICMLGRFYHKQDLDKIHHQKVQVKIPTQWYSVFQCSVI